MLHDWATRWGVPWEAVVDLQRRFGMEGTERVLGVPANHLSEEGVQIKVRLEAARKGLLLWRNNVGALKREDGKGFVRFGLANDSAKVNERIKSGDLIGIRPVHITPAHVGHTIGQFVSREVKHGGWYYTAADREPQQLAWANLVASVGGDACFATAEGTL